MSSVVSTLLIVMLWAVIMSLVTVIMLAFGVWLSSKGQSIRNASGFLLALGASYSVSFVVDIIVLAWLGRIHLFGNTMPIMTWLIISIVFLFASLRAKPSPVAIALAFVLNGLVASATGIVDYENLVVGLSLLAMVPVVYLLARSQGISADSSASS